MKRNGANLISLNTGFSLCLMLACLTVFCVFLFLKPKNYGKQHKALKQPSNHLV
jgi:hypothetical protein